MCNFSTSSILLNLAQMIIRTMKLWILAATPAQQTDLAIRAGTSRQYLYHLSSGFRDASPGLAARLEAASLAMSNETNGKLPRVYRTDLNIDCRNCDFAAKCLGAVATTSQFDHLGAES